MNKDVFIPAFDSKIKKQKGSENPFDNLQKARERSFRMYTWKLADGRTYIVKSQSQEGYYTVQVSEDSKHIDFCDCSGFKFRKLCKHSESVLKRLRRKR